SGPPIRSTGPISRRCAHWSIASSRRSSPTTSAGAAMAAATSTISGRCPSRRKRWRTSSSASGKCRRRSGGRSCSRTSPRTLPFASRRLANGSSSARSPGARIAASSSTSTTSTSARATTGSPPQGGSVVKLAEMQRLFYQLAARAPGSADLDPAALLAGTGELDAQARIGIYADMFIWRQIDALREDFPKLALLLGDGPFYAMAEDYLKAHPSRHASLSDL